MMESIHVAAGALLDPQGRVLIARRHDDAHQGGLWEFPGGKCEKGESIESALARELHEELGVSVLAHRPLIRVAHEYPDLEVLLDVHLVQQWRGEPHGREGQPLAWVSPRQLNDYPMPAADVPLIPILRDWL
jgi:8-oxo-dGTP diphosphatase